MKVESRARGGNATRTRLYRPMDQRTRAVRDVPAFRLDGCDLPLGGHDIGDPQLEGALIGSRPWQYTRCEVSRYVE